MCIIFNAGSSPSSTDSEGTVSTLHSQPSSQPGSTTSRVSSVADHAVVCAVRSEIGITEVKKIVQRKKQKWIGVMIMHNGSHDIRINVMVVSYRHNSSDRGLMLKADIHLPRKCSRNFELVNTQYELIVNIHEENSKAQPVLNTYVPTPFTLQDKEIECMLFSESKLQASNCSRLNITIEVIHEKLNIKMADPTESSGFVTISVQASPTTTGQNTDTCIYNNYLLYIHSL